MNKIDRQLQKIKSQNRLGLMTHVVVGYPNAGASKQLVKTMAEAGVDFVELQIPFSDPIADGPILMHANHKAIEMGMTTSLAMRVMSDLSKTVKIPLLFMTYFNIVFNYGTEKFCHDAAKAGCSGLIVPDIPLDEEANDHFIEFSKKYGLIPVRVLSQASTDCRIKKNIAVSNEGFIYFASLKGTTGIRKKINPELKQHVDKVRKHCDIPIAVGFGISKPSHIRELKTISDIAVVGSGLLKVYNLVKNRDDKMDVMRRFIKSLVEAAK